MVFEKFITQPVLAVFNGMFANNFGDVGHNVVIHVRMFYGGTKVAEGGTNISTDQHYAMFPLVRALDVVRGKLRVEVSAGSEAGMMPGSVSYLGDYSTFSVVRVNEIL